MPAGRVIRVAAPNRSAKQIANKALREVRKLQKNEELHFLDTADSKTVTTSWSLVGDDYLDISQGSTIMTRSGDKVNVKSVHLRGTITPSAVSTDGDNVRVIMYYREDDTVLALPLPMADETILSFRDLDYGTSKGFRILMDKTFSVSNTFDGVASAPLAGFKVINFQKHVKLNRSVTYNGSATAPIDGGISIIVIGSGGTLPSVATNLRVRFMD